MPPAVTSGGRTVSGGVTIELRPPLEFILRQTGAFRRRLLNLEPLWRRFSDEMEQIEQQWFDTEGEQSWPALAESTLRSKARRGFPSQILVATGDLRDSLTDPARAATTTRLTMEWGTDVFYAQYHQDGTDKMPAREVIPEPFPVEYRRRLEREMVTWINEVSWATFGRI